MVENKKLNEELSEAKLDKFLIEADKIGTEDYLKTVNAELERIIKKIKTLENLIKNKKLKETYRSM